MLPQSKRKPILSLNYHNNLGKHININIASNRTMALQIHQKQANNSNTSNKGPKLTRTTATKTTGKTLARLVTAFKV